VSAAVDRFRLGIVGAGRMGQTHAEAIQGSADVVVAAVVDPRPEVRQEFAEQGLRSYSTVNELLADALVDGVLIAAPTDLHRNLVELVAGAGVPVLCEKPCGLDSVQATECVAIAEDAKVPFQIAYWRRYVPQLQELRDRIQNGELGEILAVHAEQWDQSPPPPAFRKSSGGIFVDMGVHEFDEIRWLTAREFDTVKAVVSGLPETDSETGDVDCGQVLAALSDGSTAFVSLGRWHPAGDSCRVEVYGTKVTVSSWFLQPSAGGSVFKEALRRQAEDFARFVATSRGDGATALDAVAALTIAERAAENARRPR
jgi:myo-inositol 2-dehydrogenase/D-chiro-inositol 1-dehydrogenase